MTQVTQKQTLDRKSDQVVPCRYSQTSLNPIGPWTILGRLENSQIIQPTVANNKNLFQFNSISNDYSLTLMYLNMSDLFLCDHDVAHPAVK